MVMLYSFNQINASTMSSTPGHWILKNTFCLSCLKFLLLLNTCYLF